MSIRLLFVLAYLTHSLFYGSFNKQGSGADPSGFTSLTPTAQPPAHQGSTVNPRG
jgi:hypothetical protein